jgi:hypothetical protein
MRFIARSKLKKRKSHKPACDDGLCEHVHTKGACMPAPLSLSTVIGATVAPGLTMSVSRTTVNFVQRPCEAGDMSLFDQPRPREANG